MARPSQQRNAPPETRTSWMFVTLGVILIFLLLLIFGVVAGFGRLFPEDTLQFSRSEALRPPKPPPVLDKSAYDLKMQVLANNGPISTTTATSTRKAWPTQAPYPNVGAILPFKRVIAYYGNFYSKGMGALGEFPREEMLAKLKAAAAEWEAADPATPVVPAIHYIVVTAQSAPQADGMYRLRMPDSQIDHALELAKEVGGIVFIDFQVGKSTLEKELPQYEKYFAMPNVHLGIDPEFSMKTGHKPGTVIGEFDAADINYAANYLAQLVRTHNLPPKILIVHRFTKEMVTNYKKITPLPEVQIVMHMDGWGDKAKKIGTYTHVVAAEPVQFTGFKIFYKNDMLPPSTGLLTPTDLLKLSPRPIYIQYQ
jgi:hypothetical protein